jgi:tetratricopeptide (TPR) repeat protein
MDVASVEDQIADLLALAAEAFDAGRVQDTEAILLGLRTVTTSHVEINKRLGVLLANKGDFAAAQPPLEDVAAADPSDDVVLFLLGCCAYAAEDFTAALDYADRSLRLRRTSPDAHANRGNALLRLGRPAEALEAMRAAQLLKPRDPGVLVNLATVLSALGRHEEALGALDRALALDPTLAAARMNRANVVQRLGRNAEAVQAYSQVIARDPDCVEAHWNRGICNLLLGDYPAGWQGYEWRWRRSVGDCRDRGFAQPLWLGEQDLAGRTLLVHAEQGYGDCIQFARYLAEVAARGARVVLEVYPVLMRLFAGLAGVDQLVARADPLPPFDLHCPMMSLPLALGRPYPEPPAPYLAPPAEALAVWRERLGPRTSPRIGLVASGSTIHLNDANRSLDFATLAAHLPAGPDYHLLQKEVRERDREALAARPDVRVWADDLGDFADTAAVAQSMDRVVSVDTSIAHLAGAIGRPTALLLPFEPDWRWGLRAAETPWYAGMRLYRQAARGDWRAPLEQLSAELAGMC